MSKQTNMFGESEPSKPRAPESEWQLLPPRDTIPERPDWEPKSGDVVHLVHDLGYVLRTILREGGGRSSVELSVPKHGFARVRFKTGRAIGLKQWRIYEPELARLREVALELHNPRRPRSKP